MTQKKIFFGILLAMLANAGLAQDTLQQGFCYQYESTDVVLNGVDTISTFHCNIYTADTANTQKLLLKIGTEENSADIMDLALLLDGSSYLPDGISFQRQGGLMQVSIDNFLPGHYHFDIRLESSQGVLSDKLEIIWDICSMEIQQ